MPPTRRYLRLTAHTVLEVRIYLDNPADTHRWLLRSNSPALPAIIAAVRPLVLPKLQEENARAAGKGAKSSGAGGGSKKNKGWKDVVQTEDFEAALFLTENSVRHTILKREKKVRMKSEGDKSLQTEEGGSRGTRDQPVELADDDKPSKRIVREESEEGNGVRLADIAQEQGQGSNSNSEALFVSDDENEMRPTGTGSTRSNNRDDKKKLALDTTYDGFSIYGRILCLVVKRKVAAKDKALTRGTGQAMMEEWISATQMGEGGMMEE